LIRAVADADAFDLTQAQRDRLAHMVHDEVMQGLAACVLAADLGTRFCKDGRNADAIEELKVIRAGVDLAVTKLRDLLEELRIPA
jgi:signal transduction histidine kinase